MLGTDRSVVLERAMHTFSNQKGETHRRDRRVRAGLRRYHGRSAWCTARRLLHLIIRAGVGGVLPRRLMVVLGVRPLLSSISIFPSFDS